MLLFQLVQHSADEAYVVHLRSYGGRRATTVGSAFAVPLRVHRNEVALVGDAIEVANTFHALGRSAPAVEDEHHRHGRLAVLGRRQVNERASA